MYSFTQIGNTYTVRIREGGENKKVQLTLIAIESKMGVIVWRPRANIGPIHRISRNLVEMFLMPVQTQPEA